MTVDLGVLVSGSGTNLQAILDAIAAGKLDARVKLVICNVPGAGAIARAERAGVPCAVIPHRGKLREAFDHELVGALQQAGCGWIVLAGFMRVLTGEFLAAFPGRIVNIHPALLPAFPGTNAIKQALDYGVKITGCTVHYVDSGVDTGRVIAQRAVPVLPGDDEAKLAARMHAVEHELYVEVLAGIAAGTIQPLAPAVLP